MSSDSLMAQRLQSVQQRIAQACAQAGRELDSVRLLPVSKTFPVPCVQQAMALGLTRFAENRMQDLRDKSQALAAANLQWVMIGHLQTNKAREAARYASEVQSLDRVSLAQALQQRLLLEERHLDVLIQVKTSEEPSKHGVAPAQLFELYDQLQEFSQLRVKGLMTVAGNYAQTAKVRACFAHLRELRDQLQARGHQEVTRLSMGMSGDLELAILEGATEVRVGSALFGDRLYA